MALDDLWYLADEADQQAERAYHRLRERHEGFLERRRQKPVSRDRFRTLAARIRENGTPYGAHTIVYRPDGDLLLVRHEGVDMWVLPGGEIDPGESFRGAARRELAEERASRRRTRGSASSAVSRFTPAATTPVGVLPVYAARAEPDGPTPRPRDPDGEVGEARWFDRLPADTRDRDVLREWRRRRVV